MIPCKHYCIIAGECEQAAGSVHQQPMQTVSRKQFAVRVDGFSASELQDIQKLS